MNEDAQVDLNFFNIVISLSQAAIVGMGKISHPQTGKIEKNMEIAKINIDILQMLKDKTTGNLTKKEDEILTETLTNLQLTYADEAKKGMESKPEDGKEEPGAEEHAKDDKGKK
ncbi:MAG: DUF1844 domain-containing protein [Elusimicrobia bacterium]|nr:DUF1844 domain-containing protein [Elusimicrobiota bacterium]